MKSSFCKSGRQKLRRAEQGLVLIVTLLIMVAMLLVSTALMRSTNTSVQVVNNLSFRQAAEMSSNMAVELALQAVVSGSMATPSACPPGSTGSGLYASKLSNDSQEGIPDVLLGNFPLSTDVCTVSVSDMTVSFIVEAMCESPATNCLLNSGTGLPGGGSYNDGDSGLAAGGAVSPSVPVYRVSMRVDGAKNTTIYAQAFID
ncbi:MAG: hypothetical protein FWF41_06785 [Betaproteobacteria bacterium]|nr:hypothetical protein [Betaproteobacteria bacterium]